MHPEPPEPSVARFIPLVRNVALQILSELGLDIDPDQVINFGLNGLSEGLSQYRSRQGLTQREFLIYRIKRSIYSGLASYEWPESTMRRRYLFLKKANEVLLTFHLSAEGAVKRSLKAEQEDLIYLLKLLAGVAYASDLAISRTHPTMPLSSAERQFFDYHYLQDLGVTQVAVEMSIPETAASRLHLRLLEKLASSFS